MLETHVQLRTLLLQSSMVALGSAIVSVNYYVFMLPNGIMPPGLGGLVALFSIWAHQPIGLINGIANVPLFLLGFHYVGGRFLFLSLVGAACMSLFLYLFEAFQGVPIWAIGVVMGGLINGLAIAMVLLFKGATGGMDVVCVVLAKLFPGFGIGRFMILINAVIVLLAGWSLGWGSLVGSVLSIYLAGITIDAVLLWAKGRGFLVAS